MLQGWIQQEAYRRVLLQEQAFRPEFIGQRADENEEISELFDKTLANAQRGAPEAAMLRVQGLQLSQIYGWLTEHIGDLTHRMSQRPVFFEGGFQFVDEKVGKTLRSLSNQRDVADVAGQVERNLEFQREQGQSKFVDELAAFQALERLARAYANEHRKLPTYNRVQRLARSAAVKLGEWDFDSPFSSARRVAEPLEALDRELSDPENWKIKAMTVETPPK